MHNIKVFMVTFQEVMNNLESIKDTPIQSLQDEVIKAFDGYNYEGEEELRGFDSWGDLEKDGAYQLNIMIDHEDAYEFTLYVTVANQVATVTKVL